MTSSGSRTKFTGSTVLVVDDSDDNRELLALVLRGAGFVVSTASDGREGLAIAEAERPDVIVLDLAMPAMDGFETLTHLRASNTYGQPYVIVFSACDDEVTRLRARQLGANAFVGKPCPPRDMIACVQAAVDRAAEPSAATA